MKRLFISILFLSLIGLMAYGQNYKVYTDLRYGEKRAELKVDDPEQDRLLDIYVPGTPQPVSGYPVLVFIHGGGFSSGAKDMRPTVQGIFEKLLDHGYAVVSINYILARKRAEDVLTAEQRAQRDGNDQERMMDERRRQQMQQSGGQRQPQAGQGQRPPQQRDGQTRGQQGQAQSAGARNSGGPEDSLLKPGEGSAMQMAGEDAVMALQWLEAHAAEYKLDMDFVSLMGGSAGSATAICAAYYLHPSHPKVKAVVNCWGGFNALNSITDASIPMITFHGTDDTTIPIAQGYALHSKMIELGNPYSRMYVMEGRGHAQYRYIGDERMPDIITFLDEVRLGKPSSVSVYQNATINDIRYGERRAELTMDDPDQDRLLDLYVPGTPKPADGYPILLFVHGGGFSSGSKSQESIVAMFRKLTAAGYAVASINYIMYNKLHPDAHLGPDKALPATMAAEDGVMALRWIWDNAAKYGLDRNRVAVSGGSAGGATVMTMAFINKPSQPKIRAVIDLWGGIHDMNLIKDPDIPVCVFFGDKDPGFATAGELMDRFKAIGNDNCTLISMGGRGHAEYRFVGQTLMGPYINFLDVFVK